MNWFLFLSSMQPLHNPSNVASQSVVDLVRQDEILDDAVAQLHGARAYRDYYADHKPGSELPSVSCVDIST